MAIPVREPESKFTPAPEGLHLAVACDVVDLGMQTTPFGEKHQIDIWWQLEARNPDTGDRFVVRKRYTASLHEKAGLTKDLVLWRGKPFTPEERKGFDLEKLLGACCQLQTVHKVTDDGKTFTNVAAVFTAGGKKLAVENYVRQKDRPKDGAPAAGHVDDHADDDIPFVWVLPFLLPAVGAAHVLAQAVLA
jgi:hypothetical protein